MKTFARYLLIFAVSVCVLYTLKAQQRQEGAARIKDLQQALRDHKDDTAKVKLLNSLAYEYNKISPYDGIRYGIQSLDLAEELHWEPGVARANSSLGANYYSLSDYPNAYKYWLNALKINEEQGNNMGIANHQHNIGNIYYSQKNYDKALEYYNLALKTSEKAQNKELATNSYTAIGNVYTELKDYQKALEYHFHALSLDKELQRKGDIAADELNIGAVYNEQGNFAKAKEMLAQALQIKREIGDKNGMARTYNITGKVFLHIAMYVADNATGQAEYGTKENNLHHALTYLDSAIAIDKEIGYLDNMQNSYEYISDADVMLNDTKDALTSYKEYVVIKDSIFSLDKHTQINNLEKKEELEEKKREAEKEMEASERKESLEIGGICIFILMLIAVSLLLRHKKVSPKVIDILGTFSILLTFEFIELLLHGQIEKLTHHSLTLTLLCLLGLAGIIIPLHHKIEHWMKQKIGARQQPHKHDT